MKNIANLFLITILAGAVGLSCVKSKTIGSAETQAPPPAKKAPPTPEPKGLVLVKATWTKGGFGAIALWKVTIKNESDRPMGDIKFRTSYDSETGNTVSKGGVDGLLGKDTIEKIVSPGQSRTFEVNDGFVSDEAFRADFTLVSWREL